MRCLLLAASPLVLVLAACAGGQRVPNGVSEIDIRAPVQLETPRHPQPPKVFSRTVTNPSQVSRVVDWFDSLQPPGKTDYVCAGGLGASVRFTFRSANGAELARAYSPPAKAGPCDTIQFTPSGQQEAFLVDGNQGASLIGRLKRLLGPRFRPTGVYYG
jgi:hypothetical protein